MSLTPPQARFAACTARAACHLAPAGGGNTVALAWAAHAGVAHPGYRALLLCRAPARLDAFTAELGRFWPHAQLVPDHRPLWLFPSGATIQAGSLAKACSCRDYQGTTFHFVGFDRLAEFLAEQWVVMGTRAASLGGTDWKAQVRGSGDPDGGGRDWVLRQPWDLKEIVAADLCPWLGAEERRLLAAEPDLSWG